MQCVGKGGIGFRAVAGEESVAGRSACLPGASSARAVQRKGETAKDAEVLVQRVRARQWAGEEAEVS